MTSAASALSFGQAGLTGFSKVDQGLTGALQQVQSGTQTSEMDEFQAQRLADAQQYGLTQAAQTDQVMRQQLMQTLGTMTATRASANTDPTDPTGAAILNRTQTQGVQQRSIAVGNYEEQAQEDQLESGFYTNAAQQTLQDAYSNANMSLLNGFLGLGGTTLGALGAPVSGQTTAGGSLLSSLGLKFS